MKTILFLDDWMLERATGLERIWYKPTFVKQLITDFHPESLGYGGYYSVFYDDRLGKYVMYLAVYPPEADPGTFVLRLLSDDPYNWENPTYDTSITPSWKGFKDVLTHQNGDRFWPLVTRSLAGTPFADRGYVATLIPADTRDQNSYLAFSEDGLHFEIDYDHPWHNARSDTWSGITWNANRGFYQISTRPFNVDRRIATITTEDFETFSPLTTLLQPDHLDPMGAEIYSMPIISYDDLFIGLPHMYLTDPTEDHARLKFIGRVESQLAYSYNGTNWYRTTRSAFPENPPYGMQGGGQNYVEEIVRTKDNKLLFFSSGSYGQHAAYVDLQNEGKSTSGFFAPLLFEMRLDGFCSYKTKSKNGILRTKTVIPKNGKLELNLRTTPSTFVKVQILDGETIEPISGYTFDDAKPITGDHLFAQPRWTDHDDLSELIDRPIRLEFMMCEAELFAIRLECQVFIGRYPADNL